MRSKSRTPFDEKPIFFLVDALRKAGSVTSLSYKIGISDAAIYSWLDGITRPNRDSVLALQDYLEFPESDDKASFNPPVVVVQQQPKPIPQQRLSLPESYRATVRMVKIFLGVSGQFVAFGKCDDDECVFITPMCINAIQKDYGGLYEGDEFVFDLMRDITGRSTYITHRYVGPV